MISVSQAIVTCLEREGVKVVFGYPGAAICPFYDALSQSDIRHILVRTEQNAGHAANGYARMTGKPGVCVVTSGPGATNLITGISTAYMDSIPMVIITGQVSSELLGRDVFQEVDITGSVEPFIKHSYLVKDPSQVGRIFKEAFYIAGTGRPGPVLIDIPVDIQKEMIPFSYPKEVHIRSYKPSTKGHVGQIRKAAEVIRRAKRPLICAGGGVFGAKATEELLAFSQKARLPIVHTMMGISAVPSDYPLDYGMIGMHGVKPANYAIGHADVLILVGSRVGDRSVPNPDSISSKKTVIHIDIDPAEIGKNVEATIPVVGDVKLILKQLTDEMKETDFGRWIDELNEVRVTTTYDFSDRTNAVNPKLFVHKLSEKAAQKSVLVADVGQNQIWAANGFGFKDGRFLTSGGMGTMGYSVPAAMGAKLAAPDREVIAICGDGSFQMSSMELATLCQHQIPVKIIVMCNNRLGMVRELQAKQYENNLAAVFLDGSPDFVKLAEAYHIPSMRISTDEEIDGAIDALLKANGQFLLEVTVDPLESTL